MQVNTQQLDWIARQMEDTILELEHIFAQYKQCTNYGTAYDGIYLRMEETLFFLERLYQGLERISENYRMTEQHNQIVLEDGIQEVKMKQVQEIPLALVKSLLGEMACK
ncbi:MAG: hypothetical protein II073_02850 [Lachnospiraceae bacterium]|nr:hypothetical protein [Lachnospiraceae bacterium]